MTLVSCFFIEVFFSSFSWPGFKFDFLSDTVSLSSPLLDAGEDLIVLWTLISGELFSSDSDLTSDSSVLLSAILTSLSYRKGIGMM